MKCDGVHLVSEMSTSTHFAHHGAVTLRRSSSIHSMNEEQMKP